MESVRIGRVVACAVVAALALPAAASAHANLLRLRPANGAVLATPPAAVHVFFDDAIRVGPGVEAVRNGGGSVLGGRGPGPPAGGPGRRGRGADRRRRPPRAPLRGPARGGGRGGVPPPRLAAW